MPTTPVKVYGSVYEVDEAATLADMQRAEPLFFKTPHGKREIFTIHRGCLIVRNTVQFTGCPPERKTTVYLFGQCDTDGKGTFCVGHPSSVVGARRLIDEVLKRGSLREESAPVS